MANTVEELKRALYNFEKIPIHEQRLIFQGKKLENDLTLAASNLEEGSTVHVVLECKFSTAA